MEQNQYGENIIYSEPSAAARSMRNFWTRMASTYGCIQVFLSENHLIIKPRPLIGWLIRLLRLDLYHTIATNKIGSFERKEKFLNLKKIQISFTDDDGLQRNMLLYLRESEEFVNKLKQAMNK